MHERSGNSQTGVRECFNTQHKVQFSKNFSTIAVLVCFLSTIQPKLGTMEESKYVTEKPVLSGYEKARRNFQQGEIFVAFVDPTKFSYYLAADSYGKTDGSSPQERYTHAHAHARTPTTRTRARTHAHAGARTYSHAPMRPALLTARRR